MWPNSSDIPKPPKGRVIHTPGFWESFKDLFMKSGYDPLAVAPPGYRPAAPPMPPVRPPKKPSVDEAALRAKHPGLHDTYEAYQHAKLQYEMMLKLVNTQNDSVSEIKQRNIHVGAGVIVSRNGLKRP